jgi:DNA-binding NarL/FixJ family response regulator
MASPMFNPTVVLADDHGGVLTEVSMLLAGQFKVVAMVNDGAKAVQAASDLKPDVVVLDIAMPRMDGIQAASRLKDLGCTAKVIFLTVRADSDCVEIACAIGASCVLKARMYSDLVKAINEALAGRLFFSTPLSGLVSPSPM